MAMVFSAERTRFAGVTEAHADAVSSWLSGMISGLRYRIHRFVDGALRSSPVKDG